MPFEDLVPDTVRRLVKLLVADGSFRAAAHACQSCRMVHTHSGPLGDLVAMHFVEREPGCIRNDPFEPSYIRFLKLTSHVQIVGKNKHAPSDEFNPPLEVVRFHCAFACLLNRVAASFEALPWHKTKIFAARNLQRRALR